LRCRASTLPQHVLPRLSSRRAAERAIVLTSPMFRGRPDLTRAQRNLPRRSSTSIDVWRAGTAELTSRKTDGVSSARANPNQATERPLTQARRSNPRGAFPMPSPAGGEGASIRPGGNRLCRRGALGSAPLASAPIGKERASNRSRTRNNSLPMNVACMPGVPLKERCEIRRTHAAEAAHAKGPAGESGDAARAPRGPPLLDGGRAPQRSVW
jgi:hypothetical protein